LYGRSAHLIYLHQHFFVDITERTYIFCSFNPFQVALQFPDELLGDAVAVVEALRGMTNAMCFVLADTSYGRLVVKDCA
jgi:diphthamide biosynthesis enzyme Dph1/Dph2-like protein